MRSKDRTWRLAGQKKKAPSNTPWGAQICINRHRRLPVGASKFRGGSLPPKPVEFHFARIHPAASCSRRGGSKAVQKSCFRVDILTVSQANNCCVACIMHGQRVSG